MQKRRAPRVLLFVVIAALAACGGGSKQLGPDMGGFSDQLLGAADDAIDDKERKEAIQVDVEHLARVFEEYTDELWRLRTRMFYLNANYSMTEDAFNQLLAELSATHQATQREFMSAIDLVYQSMTESEWKAFNDEMASYLDESLSADGDGS